MKTGYYKEYSAQINEIIVHEGEDYPYSHVFVTFENWNSIPNKEFYKPHRMVCWELSKNEVGWIQDFLDANCTKVKDNDWRVDSKMFRLLKRLGEDLPFLHLIFANNPPSIKIIDLKRLLRVRDKLLK